MEVKVTNLVKFYTLLLLQSRPMHGYELIKEVSGKMGTKLSASHIYPFLQQLEKNKYIVHSAVGAREKKQYHLTPSGKKFVAELMDRFGSAIDAVVESRTLTCVHCDAKIYGMGHSETIKGKKLFFCCAYCAASYKKGAPHTHH